jgi:F0F1-type ATP synthase gamma subunit
MTHLLCFLFGHKFEYRHWSVLEFTMMHSTCKMEGFEDRYLSTQSYCRRCSKVVNHCFVKKTEEPRMPNEKN